MRSRPVLKARAAPNILICFRRKCSPVRRSPSYKSLLGKFLFIGPNCAMWRPRCAHALCAVAGWLLLCDSTPPADEGMASTEARRECETEGCSKDAKLQCPTCIKLGIQGSYFCSQVRLLFSACPLQRSAVAPHQGPVFYHEAASCQAR